MKKKILVPLDGSELSEIVFPWVRFLVEKVYAEHKATLLRTFELPSMVYLLPEVSIPTSSFYNQDRLGEVVMEYLEAKKAELAPLPVSCRLAIGEAADEIVQRAEKYPLVVMASHGRGGLGKWLLGSVATKVVRAVTTPILVVGAESQTKDAPALNRIVVAVDGSEVSQRAFEKACEWGSHYGAEIFLYRAVSQVELSHQLMLEDNLKTASKAEKELRDMAEQETQLKVECTVKETYGEAGILDFVDEKKADLLVMGSHGKSGFQRFLLGSETERVLQHAHCPVLVVH